MAAITDAYVDSDHYLGRNTNGASVNDATRLREDLEAVSRGFDAECGLAPGTLNDVSSVDLYLDGFGGSRLRFRDDQSRLWLVRTITTIGIDSEDDGTYDGYELTLANAWVDGYPANNATLGKPFEGLDLHTYLSTCVPSQWPNRKRSVKLSGCTLGYASIPIEVKTVVTDWTRELRDKQGAGAAAEYERLGEAMPISNAVYHQIRRIKREFNKRLPVVA